MEGGDGRVEIASLVRLSVASLKARFHANCKDKAKTVDGGIGRERL